MTNFINNGAELAFFLGGVVLVGKLVWAAGKWISSQAYPSNTELSKELRELKEEVEELERSIKALLEPKS